MKNYKKPPKGLRRRLTFFVFCIMTVSSILLGSVISLFYVLGLAGSFELKPFVFQLTALLMCPVIGTLLATFLSEIFIKPLHKLIYATREIKKGNYDVRVDPAKAKGDVLELIESYNEMAEELGSIEMFKSDFINVFSHEFKTPMVSIKGFAKQLKNPKLDEAQKNEYIDIIIDESERLSRMAANILLLSKLESQQIVTDRTSFSLDEQIRRTILLLEKEWSQKNIELDLALDDVTLINNEEMLSHVWMNIISNSIKFSRAGGRISVSCRSEGDNAIVRIEDNGIGMDQKVIDHIFEKFYQGDPSHTDRGNGLGLSIVARIVSLCSGSITVRSESGRGSVFIVEIPAE